MWSLIFYAVSCGVIAGCNDQQNPNKGEGQGVTRSAESLPIPKHRDWHDAIVVHENQPRLCTQFVFNFLANFVLANDLKLPQVPDVHEIVEFMRLKQVVPVFKPSGDHESRLGIDRFEKCALSKNALEAIREEAVTQVALDSLPLGNLSRNLDQGQRRKPNTEEWSNIRSQIIELRSKATPASVSILRRKLSDYLGTISENDKVIAVYSFEDYIPLSTVLRLQGRLVGFIGLTGPNDSMEEIELDYVIDSLTEQEYKILANEKFHITSQDLETHVYRNGLIPDLTHSKMFDPQKKELEEISAKLSVDYKKRFKWDRGETYKVFSSHDAVSLEIAADLNPNAKFLMVRGADMMFGVAEARKRRLNLSKSSMYSSNFYTSKSHYENSFGELARWLRDRKVMMMLKSVGGFAGMDGFESEMLLAGNELCVKKVDISPSLKIGEEHLLKNDGMGNDLNNFLTGQINETISESFLREALAKESVIVVEGVPNRLNYGFALRDRDNGRKGDPNRDAEILLALEHLSLNSDLRNRYPKNVFKVGAAMLPFRKQIKLFDGSSSAIERLRNEVKRLEWEEAFNWAVAQVVVDQGDAFAAFSDKSTTGCDLSYDGIYRLFEIFSPSWISGRNMNLEEFYKGALFDGFGWGYVSHGTTSFAVPVAGSLLRIGSSCSIADSMPKGYVRPFWGGL